MQNVIEDGWDQNLVYFPVVGPGNWYRSLISVKRYQIKNYTN